MSKGAGVHMAGRSPGETRLRREIGQHAGSSSALGTSSGETLPKDRPLLRLWVAGKLPTLNDEIAAAKRHWSAYARTKKAWTQRIAVEAMLARCKPVPDDAYPLYVHCRWVRADRRLDPDNIAFAVKHIEDALQVAGLISGDGWRHIAAIHHDFELGEPGVEVCLYSATEGR